MLKGKTALITGASGAIGQALARRLAAEGCNLALHYHQQTETIHALADDLRDTHHITALPFRADLTRQESIDTLAQAIQRELGTPHAFIFSAGHLHQHPFTLTTPTHWATTLALHLTAPALLIQAFSRPLLKRKSGSILCISSLSGLIGAPLQAPYAAAKAGLHGLIRSLAREWGPSRITVNALAPGYIETPMTALLTPEQRTARLALIPLNRFGTPEEIANTAAFLIDQDWVTGQILAIDGGLS